MDIIHILWKYPRSVDIIRISCIYPYFVDIIRILWKYPRSVDIIRIFLFYLSHFTHIVKVTGADDDGSGGRLVSSL